MNFDGRVQVLADRIGRPIIVFDEHFDVLAFSVHAGEIDRARLSMILSHKGSSKAQEMITEHGVERTEGPVLLPAVGDSPPRVVTSLRYRGHVTGYVSYVPKADEGAAERDSPAVQAVRDELGANLAARAAAQQNDADQVLRLATDLLDGEARQRQAAADELLKTGMLSSSSLYSVMVFHVGNIDDRSASMSRLVVDRALSRISSITSRTSLGTVIDGEGLLVIPHAVNPQRLQALIDGLSFAGAHGGGGSSRNNLIDVRESRREARIALRATYHDEKRYGATAVWEELGVDRVLLQLPLDGLAAEDLPKGVRNLLAEPTGEEMAATLESYLDNGADAQRTARMLHIHRSTLYYRLDRIRAIIEADLSDGIVRHELHTALRVARLTGLR